MDRSSPSSARAVIVTGAGSGIGRATARLADRAGWRVALAGRRPGPLEETGAGLENDWIALPTDVSDPEAVRSLVSRSLERFGRLDGLVNNASVAPMVPIASETPEGLRRAFEINALGTAYGILAVWETFERQGSGCIVNVSSMATGDPFPGFLAYGATKGAVEVMVRSCASEGRSHGIRPFGVAPGAVETEMLRSIMGEDVIPRASTLAPEDVARVIVACLNGERDADQGRTIPVPGPEPES